MTPGEKHRKPGRVDVVDAAGAESIGYGRAHAKVILLGEHAVVYGAPAIAVPLPQLTVTATVARAADTGSGQIVLTPVEPTPPLAEDTMASLRDLVARVRAVAGVTDTAPLNLLVDSAIPQGRGLGSSAACARAVVLALADLYGHRLDAATVFDLVQAAETTAHGRSSGVDALVTGATGVISYTAGVATDLTCGFDGVFVVGDSGDSGRTKDAIEHVQRVFTADRAVETDFMHRIRDLTATGVAGLTTGDAALFGAQLSANHVILRDIGLSTAKIDALVAAAVTAGARGAKISGGGLGGCMVALADDPAAAETVAASLRAAGAVDTWFIGVGGFAGADR